MAKYQEQYTKHRETLNTRINAKLKREIIKRAGKHVNTGKPAISHEITKALCKLYGLNIQDYDETYEDQKYKKFAESAIGFI